MMMKLIFLLDSRLKILAEIMILEHDNNATAIKCLQAQN